MIKEFCLAWEKNKGILENYLRTNKQSEYCHSYSSLVELLFDLVINPELNNGYVTDEMTIIDDGSYQGTLIFVLHSDCYQPGVGDYIFTNVYYGSCSGCDALQGIHSYDYADKPSEEQVKDYMDLCLHLLQNCRYFIDRKED